MRSRWIPTGCHAHGLTLRDVFERVRENNENFGGGFIEHASEQYTVRGLGRHQEPEGPEGDRPGSPPGNRGHPERRGRGSRLGRCRGRGRSRETARERRSQAW